MNTNLQLWKKIYTQFDELMALKPWEVLYESDIFGIKSPDTSQVYFISIMGSLGEVFGLSAYEGPLALDRFWKLYEYETELGAENILLIPHMLVSFDEQENLPDRQCDIIEELSLKYKGKGKGAWPNIQQISPGFFPATPDEKRLHDLTHILSQSINVIKRAGQNKAFIHPLGHHDDEYLIREQTQKDNKTEWTDIARRIPTPHIKQEFTYNTENLNAVNSLPFNYECIEMDLKISPSPIKEGNLPACFPFILMFVDSKNGRILDFDLLLPSPDFEFLIRKLPDHIFSRMIQNNIKPRKLKFKSTYIEGAMMFIQKKTDLETEQTLNLPSLDEASKSMIDHLQGYGK